MSFDNPKGHMINSNLKQARLIAQADVMCHSHDTHCATLSNVSDNTPTISRFQKGAMSFDTSAAYLCHLASQNQWMWQHHH